MCFFMIRPLRADQAIYRSDPSESFVFRPHPRFFLYFEFARRHSRGEDAVVIGFPFMLVRNSRNTGFARNASFPAVTRESTSSLVSLKRVGIELSVGARRAPS